MTQACHLSLRGGEGASGTVFPAYPSNFYVNLWYFEVFQEPFTGQ